MKLTVLKIGGNVLEDADMLDQVLSYFAELPSPAILVHGGGRKATEVISRLGLTPTMMEGRRITDAPTLEVVTMLYAGLTNKQVVAKLQARGCNALGLSGADGNIIRAQKRPMGTIDYGFAGDVQQINTDSLIALIESGFRPVCCAITHDQKGQLLNTNADTIAACLAAALAPHFAVHLQYCFEKAGVLANPQDDTSVIHQMSSTSYQALKAKGVIHSGMIPKLDNAFAALQQGVISVEVGDLAALSDRKATVLNDL